MHTGPLKLKVASKNTWMVDYMQKKGLEKGFNLVYVAPILVGGNINKMGFTFYYWNSPKYLLFLLHCISFLYIYGLKKTKYVTIILDHSHCKKVKTI